jgi:hypothetical protein
MGLRELELLIWRVGQGSLLSVCIPVKFSFNVSHFEVMSAWFCTGKVDLRILVLAERPEKFEILAVEPHEGMRKELEKKNLKNVTSREGDASNIKVDEGWGDCLITAQVTLPKLENTE